MLVHQAIAGTGGTHLLQRTQGHRIGVTTTSWLEPSPPKLVRGQFNQTQRRVMVREERQFHTDWGMNSASAVTEVHSSTTGQAAGAPASD